jgi:hypothetical protein
MIIHGKSPLCGMMIRRFRHPQPKTLSAAWLSRRDVGCSETDHLAGNLFREGDRPWLARLCPAERLDQGWLVSGSRRPGAKWLGLARTKSM